MRLDGCMSASFVVKLQCIAVFTCWPVKGTGNIASVRMDWSIKGVEKEAVVVELNGSNQ